MYRKQWPIQIHSTIVLIKHNKPLRSLRLYLNKWNLEIDAQTELKSSIHFRTCFKPTHLLLLFTTFLFFIQNSLTQKYDKQQPSFIDLRNRPKPMNDARVTIHHHSHQLNSMSVHISHNPFVTNTHNDTPSNLL